MNYGFLKAIFNEFFYFVWNWYEAKFILLSQLFLLVPIRNGGKSKRLIQVPTEVCHQIWGNLDV